MSLKEHRDWWLPIVTTFLGVFAAAYVTIAIENNKDAEKSKKLLNISMTDACSSWEKVVYAKKRLKEKDHVSPYFEISGPKVMFNLLKQNAIIFGEFHSQLSLELVQHISSIEADIQTYNFNLQKASDIQNMIAIEKQNNKQKLSFVSQEFIRKRMQAQSAITDLQEALARTAFLIELEYGKRTKKYSEKEVDIKLKAIKYDTPCNG